ncbi:hypothetical protein ASF26_19795 [Methylobacterium sp. Leaf93]|nr:hypothetical protein ASF26_19795 [Methylobacterium sp. Leaf93]
MAGRETEATMPHLVAQVAALFLLGPTRTRADLRIDRHDFGRRPSVEAKMIETLPISMSSAFRPAGRDF